MASRHFIAWLQPPLNREVNLGHLQHARREIISRRQFGALFLKLLRKLRIVLLDLACQTLDLLVDLVIFSSYLKPVIAFQRVQRLGRNLIDAAQRLRRLFDLLAKQQALYTLIDIVVQDTQLVIQILFDTREFRALDFERARVFFHAISGEDLDIYHGAVHP